MMVMLHIPDKNCSICAADRAGRGCVQGVDRVQGVRHNLTPTLHLTEKIHLMVSFALAWHDKWVGDSRPTAQHSDTYNCWAAINKPLKAFLLIYKVI